MTGICVGLVSGGIDSPVAIARIINSGWKVYPLHFSLESISGPEAESKCVRCLQHLLGMECEFGDKVRENLVPKLTVIPVGEVLSLFTEEWNHKEYFIHMKRLFNRLASKVGVEIQASHLLTGENLGQVSSQTLSNLGSVEMMSDLQVLRPLLGLDKQDIMEMARELGTLSISEGPEVCDALGPTHPATVSNLEWLEKSEDRLGGINNLVELAFDRRYTRTLDLKKP